MRPPAAQRAAGESGRRGGLRRDLLLGALILAAALAARGLFLRDYISAGIFPFLEGSDSSQYYAWARDIAAGTSDTGRIFEKWPLYAYALGWFFRFTGAGVQAVVTLQLLLGAVNCLLVYALARRLFGRPAALVAGLLAAGYPFFPFYEVLLMYTAPAVTLLLLLLLFTVRLQERPRRAGFLAAGLLTGAGTLLQANLLVPGLALAAGLLVSARGRGARAFPAGILFLSGLAAAIAPAAWHNYRAEGDLVPVSGNTGVNFYIGNNPEASGIFHCPGDLSPDQAGMLRDARNVAAAALGGAPSTAQVSRYWARRAREWIAGDPKSFVRLLLLRAALAVDGEEFIHDPEYLRLAGRSALLDSSPVTLKWLIPLAAAGALAGLGQWRRFWPLYAALVTIPATMLLFFVTTRYRVTVVPAIVIFAAAGAVAFVESIRESRWRRTAILLAAAAAGAVFSASGQPRRLLAAGPGEAFFAQRAALDRALAFERKGEYENALAALKQADEARPGSQFVAFNRGVILFRLGRADEAERSFRRAIEIFPLYVDAWYNLGILYNGQAHYRNALAVLDRAAALDPEDAGIHFARGRAWEGVGEIARAEAAYREALERSRPWRDAEWRGIERALELLGARSLTGGSHGGT